MRRCLLSVLVLVVALAAVPAPAAPAAPTRASLAAHERPGWWEEGKFGIFVHWGV